MSFFQKNEIPPHLSEFFAPAEIGLEPSPDEYIAELVAVFREVRRVLRTDGTCWLNLGDSFAMDGPRSNRNGSGATGLKRDGRSEESRLHSASMTKTLGMRLPPLQSGLAPKQLLMVPARVAIALQADGWWLRSDIIWVKPNPMPESVTDRPTSAHEHVFLLTKSARYFWDREAVREPPTGRTDNVGFSKVPDKNGKNHSGGYKPDGLIGANCRNVWTIATQPYAEAHFATFPPELAERCIKAGSREGHTILDPFSGAGTTALVADRLRRDAIGIELNPAYTALSTQRITDDAGLFAEVSA